MSSKCEAETLDGGECSNPTTEDGDPEKCWIPSHNDPEATDNPGRPKVLDDTDKQETIYEAVRMGLSVQDQAGLAQISTATLRRYACCIDDLSKPELDEDACDFCRGYAHAHSEGASNVLQKTSPEFRASASFGYRKTEKQELEHTGEADFKFTINHDE